MKRQNITGILYWAEIAQTWHPHWAWLLAQSSFGGSLSLCECHSESKDVEGGSCQVTVLVTSVSLEGDLSGRPP